MTSYFFRRKNWLPAPIRTATELFTTFGTSDQVGADKLSALSKLKPTAAASQERIINQGCVVLGFGERRIAIHLPESIGHNIKAAGGTVTCALRTWRCTVEIVKRTELHTFKVLRRRWVVERTFGWLNRYRRLSRDYERHAQTGETMVYLAMIRLMLPHLTAQS